MDRVEKVTVVSCVITAGLDEGSGRVDVVVRAGFGRPFRLRTVRGTSFLVRHFFRNGFRTPTDVERLFSPGARINVALGCVGARYRGPSDDFLPSDRAVDPLRIWRGNESQVDRAVRMGGFSLSFP